MRTDPGGIAVYEQVDVFLSPEIACGVGAAERFFEV